MFIMFMVKDYVFFENIVLKFFCPKRGGSSEALPENIAVNWVVRVHLSMSICRDGHFLFVDK